MTDYNIYEWMMSEKIAQTSFQASAICNGLKIWTLETLAEKKARILLYRRWRPKTDRKNQLPTWQAFELAIAGIDPADVVERQIEMEMAV